jgi:hypothetical protein
MMVGALAGPISFRMQCLYHDSYNAAILQSRQSRSASALVAVKSLANSSGGG